MLNYSGLLQIYSMKYLFEKYVFTGIKPITYRKLNNRVFHLILGVLFSTSFSLAEKLENVRLIYRYFTG